MKKKDIYIQESQSSCGAMCIRSIVSFYGGYVPLETVLYDTETSKNGTNAYNLVNTFNKYGFQSYGMSIKVDDLKNIQKPFIAHTVEEGYEHFLVVYEIDSKGVLAMNPACGKILYSIEEFARMYDDKIICVHKVGNIPKYKKNTSLIKMLLNILKDNNKIITTTLFLNFVVLFVSFITSFHLKLMSINDNPFVLTICFIGIKLLELFIISTKSKMEESLLKRVDDEVFENFSNHIFSLPLKYIKNTRVGEIVKKIEDMTFVKGLLARIVLVNSIDILTIIGTISILFYISPKITYIYLLVLLFCLVTVPFLEQRKYRKNKKNIRLYENFSGTLVESLEGLESIKNLSLEEEFKKKVIRSFFDYTCDTRDLNGLERRIELFKNYIFEIGELIVNLVGFLSISDSFTFYDLLIVTSLFSLAYSSVLSLTITLSNILKGKILFRSLGEFLDIPKEREKENLVEDFLELKVDSLTFSHDPFNNIIENFSFKFQKGHKYLLKGPSGSGKSTFVKCLAGVYENYKGHICLNGKDINEISLSSLRKYCIYVGQEERLFTGTIWENVTNGFEDRDYFDKVIKITELDKVIKSRPLKENTALLEGATNLSGGEKARLILARALYRRPSILIIDEVLSSVSDDMERRIIERLNRVDGLTLIYITHRNKDRLFENIIKFGKE